MIHLRANASSGNHRALLWALLAGALVVPAAGCQSSTQQEPAMAPPPAPPPPAPAAAGEPAPVAEAQPEAEAPAPPPPIMLKDVGLKTPESVLYDPEEDVYLVSNVNGSPTEANGSGFISRVSPDGKILDLKWIDGTKPDVTLNAPKGMAISGDKLYVADITFVRIFNRKTGAALGKIGVGGATFLNAIAAAPDGTLYVSDTGLKAGKDGLEPSGTDAIYRVGTRGVAETLIKDTSLNRPNGLVADDKGVWVAAYGGNELYRITVDGKDAKKEPVAQLPKGSLDGLVKTSDGAFLVASWDGSAIYRGVPPGKSFEPAVSDVKAPADIGYDSKRNAVLIPLFQSDAVQIQQLGAAAAAPAAAATPQTSPAPQAGAAPAAAQPAPAAARPAQPATAAQPAQPATAPAQPAQPPAAAPAQPPQATPAQPAQPAQPPAGAPAQPARPPAAAPAQPAQPPAAAPAQPAQPPAKQ